MEFQGLRKRPVRWWLSLGRDSEDGRFSHWLMSCMLVPWPLLRAIFFFLEKILNSSPLPCAGFARPAGRPAFTWPSSLWCLPPACRLGLPECTALWVQLWQQTSLCHLQEPGGGGTSPDRGPERSRLACFLPHPSLLPRGLTSAGQARWFLSPKLPALCRAGWRVHVAVTCRRLPELSPCHRAATAATC